MDFAQIILHRHSAKIDKLRDGDQQKLISRFKPQVKGYAKKNGLWQHCKEYCAREGEADGDDVVLVKCLQLVYYLIWMDGWYKVEEPDEPITWCID